jgi:hypothetical protein
MLQGVLADLRRTAPETRAVLAGLVLVLGAWIGPGLPDSSPSSVVLSEAPQSTPEPLGVEATARDAYREAVGITTAEEAPRGKNKPRPADEDQD